jgi:perosamine synthetase
MRREIARKSNSAFCKTGLLDLWDVRDEDECAWHLYPVRLKTDLLKIDRNDFINELKAAGIGTSVHYIPMYRFSAFKNSGYTVADFPHCEDMFAREVSLPIWPGMSKAETDYVIDAVTGILEKNKR